MHYGLCFKVYYKDTDLKWVVLKITAKSKRTGFSGNKLIWAGLLGRLCYCNLVPLHALLWALSIAHPGKTGCDAGGYYTKPVEHYNYLEYSEIEINLSQPLLCPMVCTVYFITYNLFVLLFLALQKYKITANNKIWIPKTDPYS